MNKDSLLFLMFYSSVAAVPCFPSKGQQRSDYYLLHDVIQRAQWEEDERKSLRDDGDADSGRNEAKDDGFLLCFRWLVQVDVILKEEDPETKSHYEI